MAELFAQPDPGPSLALHFSRAARLAVAGLILPPALLGGASMAGYPMRSHVEALTWLVAIGGFAATGWMAGGPLSVRRAVALQTAAAFSAGGAIVTPAFQVLQGLSGREAALPVVAGVTGGFALGFGLAGAATAAIAGARGSRLRAAARLSALGGGLGGLLALLPYGRARLGLSGAAAGYAQMALAIIAILGCLIVPCRLIGAAIDRARSDQRPGS